MVEASDKQKWWTGPKALVAAIGTALTFVVGLGTNIGTIERWLGIGTLSITVTDASTTQTLGATRIVVDFIAKVAGAKPAQVITCTVKVSGSNSEFDGPANSDSLITLQGNGDFPTSAALAQTQGDPNEPLPDKSNFRLICLGQSVPNAVLRVKQVAAATQTSTTPKPASPVQPAPGPTTQQPTPAGPTLTGTVLSAVQERALKPKDTFQECTNCPEMIVLSSGSFVMGSPAGELGARSNEGPQHTVTIAKQFAVGQYSLTFDQWDACVAGGGCSGYRPPDQGWGRGTRPVINVSWIDAQAYVTWLSKVTGKTYRLLSEAEYEYATRAGTTTAYPWSDDIKINGQAMANCDGCGSKWDNTQTAPVGSFPPNKFGLYDMVGNVSEWIEDCAYVGYDGAPTDGSPWSNDSCLVRGLRGGSWLTHPPDLRSAARGSSIPTERLGNGLRVARTLDTQ